MPSPVPSPSQCAAIKAAPGPLLVLAGPGAGKTYCLTERIHFLIEVARIPAARICAFTFTNKAAGEVASRLESRLGAAAASDIKRGTIHSFCADLLREFGTAVGVDAGFGIADEDYQLEVLRRIEGPRKWHKSTLTRFAAHRFRSDALRHNDALLFAQYQRFLVERRVLDFDTLVILTASLVEDSEYAAVIRGRWDAVLVDEFQDLNPVQYRIVRALARDHRNIFAVGDDDQSIYSWAGADPAVFKSFMNDFGLTTKIHLEENRRCPTEVFALARKLVSVNTPIFADRVTPRADRVSAYPVVAHGFDTDDSELTWLIEDIRRDRESNGHGWGDVAVLYRTHAVGDALEGAFLNAGVPCRLAHGRAFADDPVVAYVIAALRVIACPNDDVCRDAFFSIVLPRAIFNDARAQSESTGRTLRQQLNHMAANLQRADESAKQIRRALTDWRNLDAVGKRHTMLRPLIEDLLSRRVGRLRSVLDERHDEISNPASLPDVVALAERLQTVRRRNGSVWMPRVGGVEIGLKGILSAIGFSDIQLGGDCPSGAEPLVPDDLTSVGFALGVFKAAQLLEMEEVGTPFTDFTAIDLETTDRDTTLCEIVEVAAVRVRNGELAEEFYSLVRPRVPIAPGAAAVHGWSEGDVADAPHFEEIWPECRKFCGSDVIVAHNGYEFDFRILSRMVRAIGQAFELCTYDTLPLARDLYPTSRKLGDLARRFGIEAGRSHHALDDTQTLARVAIALDGERRVRARKTALANVLDHLGVALALTDENLLGDEATMFLGITRPFALGRYSVCLDAYERERDGDDTLPTVDSLIDALGGPDLMVKIRAERSADERYPAAMQRLRRLVVEIPAGPLESQLSTFLERAVLSKWDGHEPGRGRVNLLTLHSTKGLEFSRVYIVGVEDAQIPGGPTSGPTLEEVEEARRLLYVGMTRTKDRLVLSGVESRAGKQTGGHQFIDEMGLILQQATSADANRVERV